MAELDEFQLVFHAMMGVFGGKQSAVAHYLGVDESTVYRWAAGITRMPQRRTLDRVMPLMRRAILRERSRRATAAHLAREIGDVSKMEVENDHEC